MSRCFPFPPPGYSGNRASNDALIESIKLQREREKAKAERKREKKEKKREKKEKRRDKKEKAKLTSIALPLDEPAQKLEKSFPYLEGEYKSIIIEDNPEYLERSGLTEEHGQPISSLRPSYSSDSTQNSNKRKRLASPINTTSSGCQNSGNTFRIRLPMQKHKEPVASASKKDPCSTSGRTEFHVQHKHEVDKEATRYRGICSPPLVKDSVVKGLAARPDNALNKTITKAELFAQDKRPTAARPDNAVNKNIGKAEIFVQGKRPTAARTDNATNTIIGKSGIFVQDRRPTAARPNSAVNTAIGKAEIYAQDKRATVARPENASNATIGKAEILAQDKRPTTSGSTSAHNKLKRVNKQYMELFKNWVPPPLESVLPDSDDQEWLFGGKRQKREEGDKRLKGGDDVSCCASYALQPVSRYLPQADIYALPYTVPF